MNTPHDPLPQDNGESSQQRDTSSGEVNGKSAATSGIQGYNNLIQPRQPYEAGQPQEYEAAVSPMVVSSYVPTPLANIMMINQSAVVAYMQQQQQQQQQSGTKNLVIGVNPYTINNHSDFSSLSVPNPLQCINSAQFIGQNFQQQTIGAAGNVTRYTDGNGHSNERNGGGQEQHDRSTDEDDRIQTIRDRNRVHARSARQKKKEYVHQLQSLVENLHTERNEEIRKRTVEAQRTVDAHKVRRRVMVTFLHYHSHYQTDPKKWSSILEDTFWLKQPITPFRSFRRSEIEKECRISRGLEAVINDAASLSVMLESIGCYSSRWARIKREKFLRYEETKRCPERKKPSCTERQESRLQHAVSSLTCSSNSSDIKQHEDQSITNSQNNATMSKDSNSNVNKVSSSSGGSGSDGGSNGSNELQIYHNKSLPDRKKVECNVHRSDSRPSDESPEDESSYISTDEQGRRLLNSDLSSSEYDSDRPLSLKRRKCDLNGYSKFPQIAGTINLPTHISSCGEITHPTRLVSRQQGSNIDVTTRTHDIVSQHPSIAIKEDNHIVDGPHLIATDISDGSSDSDGSTCQQIKGNYHFNGDDVMTMDDVSMCPFVFRSQNAVVCGAMAECIMPGMLRARFSDRNRLLSVELVYDAMGFMQQLERASGSDSTTQIIPGSLDMALTPSSFEARVITLAQPPYLIVNVNEVWTRITGFTQIESEGIGYLQLLEGDATVVDAKHRLGKPEHSFDTVAMGQPACSANIHYDCNGRDFVEFVCSYPITNSVDEVTHILHVSRELPSFDAPVSSK